MRHESFQGNDAQNNDGPQEPAAVPEQLLAYSNYRMQESFVEEVEEEVEEKVEEEVEEAEEEEEAESHGGVAVTDCLLT
jgi:hypothetical protein